MSTLSPFLLILTILLHRSFPLPPPPKSSWSSRDELSTPAGFVDCVLCKTTVKEIQDLIALNKTFEELFPSAVKICESVLDKVSLNGRYMCPGIVSAYGVPVQIVASKILLDPSTICQDLNTCGHSPSSKAPPITLEAFLLSFQKLLNSLLTNSVEASQTDYLPLREGMKSGSPLDLNQSLSSTQENSSKKRPVHPKHGKITFLQISDIHFDPNYAEGSPTDCGLYFCCRSWYNGTGKAGHYGAYNCDLPISTFDLLFKAIVNLHPFPDFIIYTGDNPPHDVWNETWSSQIQGSQTVVDHLAEMFPTTTIYPVMGNHDSWPANLYSGAYKQYQRLNRDLSKMWQKWVDFSPEAVASIARGGHYSSEVTKGLRLISFNTNYGYLLNFYAFLNYKNEWYREQWAWLEKELQRARHRGEKVLLVGHIPPGDEDNWEEYGHNYLQVTKEYKDIIAGHLFGHTHMDHFQLIQDEEGVHGVVLVAPSLTPFGHINPSFRTFTMDTNTMTLENYTQYHLNLTQANDLYLRGREDEVGFVLSYSTDEEYHLRDLSPQSWSELSNRFLTDPELLDAYYYNRYGRSKEENRKCDQKCRKQLLCEVNHVISTDVLDCRTN